MAIDLVFDREHVWHPYTSLLKPLPTLPVVRAQGVHLFLEDGTVLVDGMASWWCAIFGYNHPVLNSAIQEQLGRMAHVMFGGITHEPAVNLAKRLLGMLPASLEHVFFADSGSIAVEVALKMALQYWHAAGTPRQRFLTVRKGYHGDTTGAMSVCDPDGGMHEMWQGYLPQHYFADAPPLGYDRPCAEEDLASVAALLAVHHEEIAAVILEPVVQGAGGMRFYNPEYLTRLRELVDSYGVLLIYDEIATGFGRTGKMFAMDHGPAVPDIVCLGKALTGGYLSLAATVCSARVKEGIGRDGSGVLMHGPTFMANPLACAVAYASLGLLQEQDWQTRVLAIEAQLKRELEPARSAPGVEDVRVLGAIGVVELKKPVVMAELQREFVRRGVWIRPFGKLVYLMPPYTIEGEQLSKLTSAICEVCWSAEG